MKKQVMSANGKAKCKGSFTPNFDHKYDKVGERIMKELQKNGSSSINPDHDIPKLIVLLLIRSGVVSKTCVAGMWLIEPVVCINREPKINKRKAYHGRK